MGSGREDQPELGAFAHWCGDAVGGVDMEVGVAVFGCEEELLVRLVMRLNELGER